ncbi:hypothetical protein SELMODRAFT_227998 [Selaginella moellendorffii]|uniref:FYVE-type domain-containing protein n=1 Tax=Selaginella moellendorffii TaxID=88036 RepID=D8RI30_SELML|nr:hypothetical protein SELMODRAFT_227998 [Selaginella moellendorffii]
MALVAPPAFEEAAHCAICGCGFGTFKRRHHCRACGRTLCNEHSSNQMALPQFGLHGPVRVCKDCFTAGDTSVPALEEGDGVVTREPSENDSLVPEFSSLNLNEATVPATVPANESTSTVPTFECKCGMPLCICSAPEPEAPKVSPQVSQSASSSRSKKTATSSLPTRQDQPRPLPVKQSPRLFFTGGQSVKAEDHAPCRSYDISGEGIREAIKNGDAGAVKNLLSKVRVDAKYTDKQGMSLLHLAAVFNLTEIAFMLLDSGAEAYSRNLQGETPLDCAQTTLQLKLLEKLARS